MTRQPEALWFGGPQVFDSVPLVNGRFNVILGTTDTAGRLITAAFGAKDRFLGIKVDANAEIAPRQQILSTPFAVQAEHAAKADVANTSLNGVPIGTILAWHKNLTTNPVLPYGWIACNGQILNDSASPYNGKTIPNLNGEGRFLRGSSNSGILQDMDWKSFYVKSDQSAYRHDEFLIPKIGYNAQGIFGGKWEWAYNTLNFRFDEQSEVRPKNMSVVWIIRVK